MYRTAQLLAAVSVWALVSASAHAQNIDAAEAVILRAQIDALKAQVESLEARLDASDAADTPQNVQPAPASATVSGAESNAAEINFKGAPETSTPSGWSFKPRGRIQYDAAYVSAPEAITDPGLGFSNELRRVRLGVSGDIPGGFGYKMEADFANNEVVLTDAILTYETAGTNVTIGQHNNFQSLEELTSSLHTSFLERAAFTDAFNFERRAGLSLTQQMGDLMLSGGVFTANIEDLTSDENESIGFDGRAVYAPRLGNTRLHLGASAHWRDLGGVAPTVRYRQRPAVHSTDTRFLATPTLGASSETSYGLEAAAIRGRFHAATEAYWMNPDLNRTGIGDPVFFGAYAEAGIFLTNDTRGYKDGKFDRTKPSSPLGGGGLGAVQFNIRYDRLDLSDNGIIGGSQDGYNASIIWTPVDYVRFLVNYNHLVYQDATISAGTDRNYSVDSVGMRAQVDF